MENEPNYISLPSEKAVVAERERLQYRKKYFRTLRTTLYALVVVAAAAVLVATLFFPVLQISGSSMEPTLSDEDIVVLLKGGNFESGELVAFYYQNKLLLKRVIPATRRKRFLSVTWRNPRNIPTPRTATSHSLYAAWRSTPTRRTA